MGNGNLTTVVALLALLWICVEFIRPLSVGLLMLLTVGRMMNLAEPMADLGRICTIGVPKNPSAGPWARPSRYATEGGSYTLGQGLGIASAAFSDRAPKTSAVAIIIVAVCFLETHYIVSQRLLTAYNTRCVSLHLCFSGVYRNPTLAVPTVYRNCTAYVPKLHMQNCHVPNATSTVPNLTCTEIVHALSRKCHVPIWMLPDIGYELT